MEKVENNLFSTFYFVYLCHVQLLYSPRSRLHEEYS